MQEKRKISTIKKIYLTSALIIFAGIMIFSLVPVYTASFAVAAGSEDKASEVLGSEPNEAFASDGVNYVSTANLLPGDIVLLGTSGTFFDYLIPGSYSHTVVYCGTVASGQSIWDRDNHVWMATGTHYVIHSTKSSNAGNGLGYSRWDVAVNQHADNVLVLRVLKSNGAILSSTDRTNIVNFCKGKLTGGTDGYPIGPAYDINWLSQQTDGSTWYCSEIAWAAYKVVLSLDLDSNTSPFGIGVSPDDLWHSQFTSVIAGESGSSTFNAPSDIVRVSVFVDEIYYDDDYDGLLAGAGEMYIISRSGLGRNDKDGKMLATEQGYPGNGKIGNTPNGYWSRNGAGALDWNKYFYALCGWNQYMRIRVEAWEQDTPPIDPNDQYPVWQWYWASSTWNAKTMGVWYDGGYRVDLGACRYTIDYKIDIVY